MKHSVTLVPHLSANRVLGLLAASALIVTGCGGGSADSDDGSAASDDGSAASDDGPTASDDGDYDPSAIFRYAVPGSPTSFDPRQSAPLDPVFLDVVYESLISRTPEGELVPSLATEWSFSDDYRSLELTLREGVTFHSGGEFDSAAVVASMEAFQESGAQASSLETVDQVEALGPYSVRIDFSEPSGYMLNMLASEAGVVVAPEALDNPDLSTEPDGTGPFQLTDLRQGQITFAKFEDHWNADEISIAGIEMTVFSDEPTRLRSVVSGEMHGTTISEGQMAEAEANGLSLVQGPNSTIRGILLNTSASEFGDPLVRKAIMYAIDREAISQSLFDGVCVPSVQPFGEGLWPNIPELNDVSEYYDVDQAKSLLDEAGLTEGFSFDLIHGPNTTYQNLSQILQAQLAEVGIDVNVRALEFSQMVEDRRTGNYAAAVSLLQVGRPDPSEFVTDFYLPGGTFNAGDFSLDDTRELLAESRVSSDEAERMGPTQQIITDVFEAGPPMLPICGVTWVAAFQDSVTGFQTPTFGDYDFASVKISN